MYVDDAMDMTFWCDKGRFRIVVWTSFGASLGGTFGLIPVVNVAQGWVREHRAGDYRR